MPASSSTLRTPVWAKPRAPPPPSTNAIRGRSALRVKTNGSARGGCSGASGGLAQPAIARSIATTTARNRALSEFVENLESVPVYANYVSMEAHAAIARCIVRHLARRAGGLGAAELSAEADPLHRALPRRRHRRRVRAHYRRQDRRGLGPAGGGGEPRRRGREYRRRARREERARRPHDPYGQYRNPGGERESLPQYALRLREGFHYRRAGDRGGEPARAASFGRRGDAGRADRARPLAARETNLRPGGRGHDQPPRLRAVQIHGARGHHPH